MTERRLTKQIMVGDVPVGGGAPVAVQSMTKTDTRDVKATVAQITSLAECGCELTRLAVPDNEAAGALAEIRKQVKTPLIADIHFDYRLALLALAAGADGLRLNPGNIGAPENVKAVVLAARERGVPVRIGVNAGSLPQDVLPDAPVYERMVAAALRHVEIFESLDFNLIKISLKAFDVPTTIEAYRRMAEKTPYPLHVGITEAGLPPAGLIRSTVGIGTLLYLGIGDTIRVSLTAPPEEEVAAAYEILKSLELREKGAVLVSCPMCGRTEADILGLARAVERELAGIEKPVRVAVMGCVVNGPGEAKDADVGIACGRGRAIIFRKGEKVGVAEEGNYLEALMREVREILNEA